MTDDTLRWLRDEHRCVDCKGTRFDVVQPKADGPRATRPFCFEPDDFRPYDCPARIACDTCGRQFELAWEGGKLIGAERFITPDELGALTETIKAKLDEETFTKLSLDDWFALMLYLIDPSHKLTRQQRELVNMMEQSRSS
jgi:hypothetical protein